MIDKKKPDWDLIRAEYVRSNIGYRRCALTHGVLFTTLSKRATREEWHRLRTEFRAARHAGADQTPAANLPSPVSSHNDAPVERLRGHLRRICEQLENQLEKASRDELTPGTLGNIRDLGKILRQLAATLSDLQHSQDEKLGQRRLIRPGVLASARSYIPSKAYELAVPIKEPG